MMALALVIVAVVSVALRSEPERSASKKVTQKLGDVRGNRRVRTEEAR